MASVRSKGGLVTEVFTYFIQLECGLSLLHACYYFLFIPLESFAYYIPLSSSSNASKAVPISASPYFKLDKYSAGYYDADHIENSYALETVVGNFYNTYLKSCSESGSGVVSEELAKRWLQWDLFSYYQDLDYTVSCEIPGMYVLPAMYCGSRIKPDVAVYQKSDRCKLVFAVEVQSSPMIETLKKTTYLAASILRFLKCENKDVNEFTAFAIPSINEESCITKVCVDWKQLKFNVKLTLYENPDEGRKAMKEVLSSQMRCTPYLPVLKYCKYPIILNNKDLQHIGIPEAQQIPTTQHLVLEFADIIYKIIYELNEQIAYYEFVSQIPTTPKFIIKPKFYKVSGGYHMCEYQKVRYPAMMIGTALLCIKDLLSGIKNALDELHSYGLSHNDVRIPNICFNEAFEAVLIDVDRVYDVHSIHPLFGESTSCLYQIQHFKGEFDGKNTDFMQVGWLAAFILDHSQHEHSRKWKDQKDEIQNCKFIYALINHGKWDSVYFNQWKIKSLTIKEVL